MRRVGVGSKECGISLKGHCGLYYNHCTFCEIPTDMENLIFCLIVQMNLFFGLAGLIWPEKLMPLYGILMFPWPPSHRGIRIHGVVAIGGYFLVLGKFFLLHRLFF